MNNKDTRNDDIDLMRFINVLLDNKYLLLFCTIVCATLGLSYSTLSTPVYTANAVVQVDEKKSGNILKELSDGFTQESSPNTEIEVIKSRLVLAKTVEDLNLTTEVKPIRSIPFISKGLENLSGYMPDIFVTEFTPENEDLEELVLEIGANKGEYRLYHKDGETLILEGLVNRSYANDQLKFKVSILHGNAGQRFSLKKIAELAAIERLQQRLHINEKGKQTGVIEIAIRGENQRDIKNIIKSVSESYVQQNAHKNAAEASKSLELLRNRLPEVREKLVEAENSLNKYKEDNSSIDLDLEAKSYLDRLVRIDADLNALTIKEGEIAQKFTKRHPTYVALLNQKKTLRNEKAKIAKEMENLPATQRDMVSLNRELEVDQQIYMQLSNKLQELDVVKAGAVGNARILDTAQVLPNPSVLSKAVATLLSGFLGFVLGLIISLIKALFNRTIQSPAMAKKLGLTAYTSIPNSKKQPNFSFDKFKQGRLNINNAKLLSESAPTDAAIEAIRGLRADIHFAMQEAENKVLMVSSASYGTGNTFIATNLANIVAKSGKKVLLIDVDTRYSYLDKLFNTENKNGIGEALTQSLSFESVVSSAANAPFDVISKGKITENLSEHLLGERFQQLLSWANTHYDLVIIDTPPVLSSSDAAIIGRYAGSTILVGRFEETTHPELEATLQHFERASVKLNGFVLNCTKPTANNRYQ
ncbi:polysaccharide biosynthesis tyrosine autokinase [Actinobacillus capsulatus]|uniref:polysaccharide biosynthesis tyrosine autokinase n=1 Tax=Actinobacillus capsulatus TaxID=717 RepID=UPI0003641958|nr:polysaccharide biosynthesis tyrosine autokinase [Actinobacillus capsulatus]